MLDRLQTLGNEIMDELLDPEYDTRTHGGTGTYAAGCKGPLCTKADRDASAAKYRRKVDREVKEYAPRKSAHPEEWLAEVIAWHKEERSKMTMGRSWREYHKIQTHELPMMADQ